MKEFINLLTRSERRIIVITAAVLAAAAVFYFFIALPQRSAYFSRQMEIRVQKKEYQKLETQRADKKKELAEWIQAQEEIKELRLRYFYRRQDGYQNIRQDLGRIFQKTGVTVDRIRYDYVEAKDADIQKVIINFEVSGRYDHLRGFLHEIETFPKFIWVERINFGDTEEASRKLSLNLTLAAYNAL